MLSRSALSINIITGINKSMDGIHRSLEKLTSGYKINRASDDPAGLVISEQLRSRIASLNQEISNIGQNSLKFNTADSAVLELRRIVTEIRSYTLAASNAGMADENVTQAWQHAADGLVQSYNMIIDNTTFGTHKLLDGSAGSVASIDKLSSFDFSSPEGVQASLESIDSIVEELDIEIMQIGSRQNQEFISRERSLRVELENLTAAESSIRDTDYMYEYTNMLKERLVLHANVSLLAHSFINDQTVLRLTIPK